MIGDGGIDRTGRSQAYPGTGGVWMPEASGNLCQKRRIRLDKRPQPAVVVSAGLLCTGMGHHCLASMRRRPTSLGTAQSTCHLDAALATALTAA